MARSVRRVAVIGAGGQLGSDIVLVLEQAPDFEVVPLFHRDVEVTDAASVQAALDAARCDVVVNCAAFHRVDECEERADEAFRVNAIGAWNVARACARLGAQCVFVSTDYVFSGEKGSPYVEDDRPDPINVYGLSKAAGEWLVRNTCPDAIVLRVSSLFGPKGASGKGGNFVETILAKARAGENLRVVSDQWMSPTYTWDAAEVLRDVLRAQATGTFHACNTGRCSWWEFATSIVEAGGLSRSVKVEKISEAQLARKARRPRDAGMATSRLEGVIGATPRPWRDALSAYMARARHVGC